MTLKSLSLRIFLVIFGLCFLLGMAAAWKFRRPHEVKLLQLPEKRPPKQAAQYIFEPAPFYFPLKTRGVGMSVLKPFSQDFTAFGRQNSHGFRTPEYTISHPPDTFRIVVLGDAVTWGTGVALEDTFSYQLGERFNSTCSGFKTEVIALGVTGHKLKENLLQLVAHAQSLDPDLVIFQFSPIHVEFYGYFSFLQIHKAKNPYQDYASTQQQVFQPDSMDRRVIRDSLSEIHKWSRKQSTPVCFVAFWPIDASRTGKNFNHYDPGRMAPYLSAYPSIIEEIRAQGFPILDLLDTFQKKAGDRYLAVTESNANPNAFAHGLVADALYSFLIQNHVAGCQGIRFKPQGQRWKEDTLLQKEAIERWKNFNVSFADQVSFFQKVRKIHPEDAWTLAELASVNFSLKRYQNSFALYDSLSELAPEYGAPWYHLALTSPFTRRRIELLEKMIRLVPDHALAINFLATLYLNEKRTADGCTMLNRILQFPSYQEQYDLALTIYNKSNCSVALAQKQ